MRQLPLNILGRLAYSPDNFVLHSGNRSAYDECVAQYGRDNFRVSFIRGGARSGKTHLSISLSDALSKRGFFPRLVEGAELGGWIELRLAAAPFEQDEVVVVDDVDHYLAGILPGSSGPFVAMVEQLRLERAGLIMFSTATLDDLPCDEHVKSRLVPGLSSLGGPEAEEMQKILKAMALQRGLSLTGRQIAFLAKRVGRDVGSIEQCLGNINFLSQLLGKSIKFPLLGDAV